jgi:hypothetical protein
MKYGHPLFNTKLQLDVLQCSRPLPCAAACCLMQSGLLTDRGRPRCHLQIHGSFGIRYRLADEKLHDCRRAGKCRIDFGLVARRGLASFSLDSLASARSASVEARSFSFEIGWDR